MRKIMRVLGTARGVLRRGGAKGLFRWGTSQARRRIGVRLKRAGASRDIPSFRVEQLREPRKSLRAATVLDEFSYFAWSFEFDLLPVTPDSWRQTIDKGVDFALVESAWAGSAGAWRGHLVGSAGPSAEFRAFANYCAKKGVPLVFWNKEDPPHFRDFLSVARFADFVFTTDSSLVDSYKSELGHSSVEAMPFAAQPRIHNPTWPSMMSVQAIAGRPYDLVFAGMYFRHKFELRRQQMDVLLGAAARVAESLRVGYFIFSRYSGGDQRYQFPEQFAPYIRSGVPYEKMLSVYRRTKLLLNVNTVTESPTMCSRRIFEGTACGSLCVSTESVGVSALFPNGGIVQVSDPVDAEKALRTYLESADARDREVHLGQREIWERHTYLHRANQIRMALGDRTAGAGFSAQVRPKVSVAISTRRRAFVEKALDNAARQRGVDVELKLVTHGFEIEDRWFQQKANVRGLKDVSVVAAPQEYSLGRCLNLAIEASSGEFIAKMDDDDYYAPNYLRDQVNALKFSYADVVGKQAHYVRLEESDELVLRRPAQEHQFVSLVSGATIVAPRKTFEVHPFPDRTRGEDTTFLEMVLRSGGTIYSSDRFNFALIRRRTDPKSEARHTWDVDNAEFLQTGTIVGTGLPLDFVDV